MKTISQALLICCSFLLFTSGLFAQSTPTAPSDARLKPLSPFSLKLSWRDNSTNETSFEVERTLNGNDYTLVASLPAGTTSYTDTGLSSGTPYTYRVCADNGGKKSAYSISNGILTADVDLLTCVTKAIGYKVLDQYSTSGKEGSTMAIDGDPSTKYYTGNKTTWIRVQLDEAVVAKQYSLTSANDAEKRDPKNWKIEGSDDGRSWTTIDTQKDQSFISRFQTRVFELDNETAYLYYRFSVSANNGETGTQIADWLLYAELPPVVVEETIPTAPNNFRVAEKRSFNSVKLSWTDRATNETNYLIEQSSDDGATYEVIFNSPANDTEAYPYALEPETTYKFRISAVNSAGKSDYATTEVTTDKREWVETWENLSLWINDNQPVTVNKVKEVGENVAFYLLPGVDPNDIDDVYYEAYAENWNTVYATYGKYLSDPRLHVMLFPQDDGGGVASIGHYRDGFCSYRNIVYVKANKDWFKNGSRSGFIYDVMAHELCHIIEGVGGAGFNRSLFYGTWGDSKWAEIFQYDTFKNAGSPRAATWHNEYMNGSGGADYPNPDRVNYWYRDFWYPIYEKYGETKLLQDFWRMQRENHKTKNGEFVGNGNLGLLIHYFSGAAGVDVQSYAANAFGWNANFEMQLLQARKEYPGVTYTQLPIDGSTKNIFQNGGTLKSNISTAGSSATNLIDNDYTTTYKVTKSGSRPTFIVTYSSKAPALASKYVVTIPAETSYAPASWVLSGSNDGASWEVIDQQETPAFESQKMSLDIKDAKVYSYFQIEFTFERASVIELAEIELFGIEYISSPADVRVRRLDNEMATYIDWSCLMDEVGSYEIERSTDGVDFSVIGTADKYEISYKDTDVAAGKYYYRVAVINRGEKPKVYSDIVSIEVEALSVKDITVADLSFNVAIANLSDYPQNQVKVYTTAGVMVYNSNYTNNNFVEYLQDELNAGVYIVTINLNNNQSVVRGKVIVK